MSLTVMKPTLCDQPPVREQFRYPMDTGSAREGARDFNGIETRLETRHSRERNAHAALMRENRLIQRLLDDRDRQFAALQEEVAALKRDWAWRTLCMFRRAVIRLRRQFWGAARERAAVKRNELTTAARGT